MITSIHDVIYNDNKLRTEHEHKLCFPGCSCSKTVVFDHCQTTPALPTKEKINYLE